jgi:hypothetical protein
MGYQKNFARQWKLCRHSVLQNIRENERESAYAAPARIPITKFRRKTNKPVGKISLLVSFGDLDNA